MSTYVPIQAITLSSAIGTVTFSNIPATYTDLVLVFTTNTAINSRAIRMRLNEDTSTLYSTTVLYGDGSSALSKRNSAGQDTYFSLMDVAGTDNTANNFQPIICNVMNYSNTTTNKTLLFREAGKGEVGAIVGLYRSTSAITSITLQLTDDSNWSSGNTFTLYGVGTGSPKAFGGTTVTTDGTYWYHTFQSSGVFEPLTNLSDVDYLVVAGGGAGGSEMGGGGGAGGVRCTLGATGGGGSLESKLSLTANTAYAVTIGAGGTGAASNRGGSGNNSIFASITSIGGGGGGGGGNTANNSGANGGSGGGGGYTGGNSPGGTGTTAEGYAGGASPGSAQGGGGGGGSNAIGSNAYPSWNGGNGGNGIATSISGSSVNYGGGGGGGAYGGATAGTGGLGGGGAGSVNSATPATAGTANTGGGGGGRGSLNGTWDAGANGGSGIVIIRYAV